MSGASRRLEGKVAVVTGAAAGIGRATAVRFAAEGARLVVNDVNAAGLERVATQVNGEFGAEVTSVVGDVSQDADARRIVEAAVTAYTGLDVLVANAGSDPLGTLADSTPDDWDHVMSVDGRGMFLTCKYAVAAMRETGPRRIRDLPELDLRHGRPEGPGDLRPRQVRRHRPHQAPRGRARRARHPGQRRRTRHHQHRARAACPTSTAARSTSRRSSPSTRWVAWAAPTRSPPRSSSSPATTRRSSPAPCCRSTAASSRSSRRETTGVSRPGSRTCRTPAAADPRAAHSRGCSRPRPDA